MKGFVMVRSFRASWALVCLLLIALLAGCNAGDSALTQVKSSAEPEVPFPLPIVEVAGTPKDMGGQHGTQLGQTIRDLHAKYLKAYFSSEGERFLAMAAAKAFESRVSPDHLEEIKALAKASGVDPRQML